MKVQSLEAEKRLLRYNDYKNDPFSMGNPTYTISARGDFLEGKKRPFFAYDAKVTSWSRIVGGGASASDIVNGPTHDQ